MTKFNTGDYVRCNTNGIVGNFTKDKVYKVKEPKGRYNCVIVEHDDKWSSNNGLNEEFFDLVRKHDEPFKVGDVVTAAPHNIKEFTVVNVFSFDKIRIQNSLRNIYIVDTKDVTLFEPASEHKENIPLQDGECNKEQTELSLQDAIYIEAEAGIPLTKVADVINAIEERGFMLIKKGK